MRIICFKKIILEQCSSVEQLKEQEKYWISTYNACTDRESYNISTGGTGGDTFTHNPNKERIREKLQARRHTEDTKKKISKNKIKTTDLIVIDIKSGRQIPCQMEYNESNKPLKLIFKTDISEGTELYFIIKESNKK